MTSFPDWNDMATLLEIHDRGSLSAAARALGVSQSTMSRRLAALEARGVRVFSRDDNGSLRLLPAGEPVLAAARAMKAAYDRAAEALAATPNPIRIAACEVTARLFLADALPAWSAKAKAAADLAVYDDLFMLPAGVWDVVVTPIDDRPVKTPGVRIGAMTFALYAAPAYLSDRPWRDGPASLDGHRVIGASGSLAQIAAWEWLAAQGGSLTFTASSVVAHLEAAARGQGIALLPTAIADHDGRLVRLDYTVPGPAEVWLLASEASAGLSRVADFLRWARWYFDDRPTNATRGV